VSRRDKGPRNQRFEASKKPFLCWKILSPFQASKPFKPFFSILPHFTLRSQSTFRFPSTQSVGTSVRLSTTFPRCFHFRTTGLQLSPSLQLGTHLHHRGHLHFAPQPRVTDPCGPVLGTRTTCPNTQNAHKISLSPMFYPSASPPPLYHQTFFYFPYLFSEVHLHRTAKVEFHYGGNYLTPSGWCLSTRALRLRGTCLASS